MKSTDRSPFSASRFPFKAIIPLTLGLTNLSMCSAANAPAIAAELPNPSTIPLAQTAAPREVPMPGAYISAVLQDAYKRTNLPPATLRISQAKSATFSNPCVFNFGSLHPGL